MTTELAKNSPHNTVSGNIWKRAVHKSRQAFHQITKRIQDRTSTRPSSYVEAYLFCPNINWLESRGSCHYFFTQGLAKLDNRISDQALFLTQQSAFQYSRFMGDTHAILKMFVPEHSIEGRSQKLVLKKGFATLANIQGCYLSKNNRKVFYPNPQFDMSFLVEKNKQRSAKPFDI